MAVSKRIKDVTKLFIDKYIDETTKLPIRIDEIIKEERIVVEERALSNDMSGLLIIKGDSKMIGVENSHSNVRQRFTLAHELGHFVLHSQESKVFTDVQLLFKRQSDGYSSREEKMEQEANYFAANILMPENLVKREVVKMQYDLHDDANIEKLAVMFDVSLISMTYRLTNLGII